MLAAVCFASCALFSFLDISGSARILAHERGVRGKKPEFLDKTSGDYVQKVGEKIILKCDVYNWQSTWKMMWYKNGKIVQSKQREIRMRTSQLKIHRLKEKDAGVYTCVASNKYGMVSRKLNLTVKAQGLKGKKPEFIYKSSLYYVKEEGTRIHMKCNVLNWQPSWKMTWYVNGKLIKTKKRKYLIRMVYDEGSRLTIHRAQMKDTGMYECVASNKYGSVSKELNLTVIGKAPGQVHGQGPPRFVKYYQKQFVAWPAMSTLKLRCAADGEPPLKYQWLKDGKVLKYRRLDPKLNASKWFLRISTVVPSDNGLYTCIVSNRWGNISSKSYKLTVIEKLLSTPILSTRFPVNKTAKIGENVTFQCVELFSRWITDYRWLHWNKLPAGYPNLKLNEDAPSANSSYFTLISWRRYRPFKVQGKEDQYGGRVLLTNVTKEDEGMYTCLISNHIGKVYRSAFLKIVTSENPQSSMETYKMKTRLGNEFDDSGKLACSVSVTPNQPMKKTKNDKDLKMFTITLKSVKPKDNETYTCNVSNQQDSINMTYEMHEPAERSGPILEDFQDVITNEGKNVTLICKAFSIHKPKLIWFAFDNVKKQYDMIKQGKRMELKSVRNKDKGWHGQRLRLLNVTPGDSKRYLCLGINVVSSRTQSVFVKVLPKKQDSKEIQ